MRPALFSVNGTTQQIPHGRTRIYELINEGELEAVKSGKRTFITAESIDRYIAKLKRVQPKTA
jgi:excisionase family DNA binding protein